jgi:hypothetical protein
VVDPDGVIQIMEITCEGVGRNANELVRKIRAAQYVRAHPGEVCPAAWEEGAETLAPRSTSSARSDRDALTRAASPPGRARGESPGRHPSPLRRPGLPNHPTE